jgi:hypothetical protein
MHPYALGMSILQILDVFAIITALLAAWLWFRASSCVIRRVNKSEDINSLDLNRIVTALNRSQKLNRRAALATAASALVIALKYGFDLIKTFS